MNNTKQTAIRRNARWILRLTAFWFICLLITGCDKHGYFSVGYFSDHHLESKTKFSDSIREDIMFHGPCRAKFPPKDILDESYFKHFKDQRVFLFYRWFPKGSDENIMLDTLRNSSGTCIKNEGASIATIDCAMKMDYIMGLKGLGLLGREVISASLIESYFNYAIKTKDNKILEVEVNNISNQCYEIDKKQYENNGKIKIVGESND
ncbi:hypothetical protein [Methylomonas sp. ZR1]|uniref:hypothetical protein n=1 Tax=Methylomonas sp. ZR1 TaxID=1797072 RepID=UPI001490F05A|nr:hypothetical protein [Methylomonas sp. ZR1]NOV29368.1 hypothetical protein [Methylomonas sp. ZR1]